MAWYPSGVLFGGSFLKTWAKKRIGKNKVRPKKMKEREREKKERGDNSPSR